MEHCIVSLRFPDVVQCVHMREYATVLCASLQPKWGYLPPVDDVRGRVCRFCMHQFLKVKEGKWKSHSSYCPVDLFSGCVISLLLPLSTTC